MNRFICLILITAVCIQFFTACSAQNTPTVPTTMSVIQEPDPEPIVWNDYDTIQAVEAKDGYLIYWPDAQGATSYRVVAGSSEAVSTYENTYLVPSGQNVTVAALDDKGTELAVLSWNGEGSMKADTQDGWFDLYSEPADSEVYFHSDNASTVNKMISVDMTAYPRVKVCYEAQLSSYTTGPSHYSGRPDDCTSAGVKICMGDTRTLVSIEKDTLVAGVGNATWGNSVEYSAGNDWHSYEVLIDNTKNTYTVSVDGVVMMTGQQSARSIIANNVEFYALGTGKNPADVRLQNIRISCEKEDNLPIWNYACEISSVSHSDGFTLVWPTAKNAEYYMVQIGDETPVKVTENTYRATNLAMNEMGYDVKIQAYSSEGGCLTMLNKTCNVKFDAAKGYDNKIVLTGNLGGSNSTKYAIYRIPGMIVTSKNTLIMFYEARIVPSDNGGMDLIAFRSTDGGETFSEPIMLAEGASTSTTMNNAVMIPDGDTIHLVYSVNYGICNACAKAATGKCQDHGGGGVYYRKSVDDGITWSEPVNISDSTNPKERYLIAPGPGAGIRRDDGTLIVPVWLVQKKNGDPSEPLKQSPGDIAPLYSTDGGNTWQMGEVLKVDFATTTRLEPLPAVLSDGRIMYNIRVHSGWRGVAVSDDGINDFTTVKFDKELIDPFCNAGFTSYNHGDDPYTLLFTNCENNEALNVAARKNLVLKASVDDGETWSMRLPIDPGEAGYSAVIVDQNGIIYILYEVDIGKNVRLVRLTYDYLVQNSTPME